MDIKELLYQKRIKQAYLAKALGSDPQRVSVWVNKIVAMPDKYREKAAQVLGVSLQEIDKLFPKKGDL